MTATFIGMPSAPESHTGGWRTTVTIPEIARLGRPLRKWKDAHLAYFDTGAASNAPHRSHQRTLSNQAEKPPEATATPPTTNSECSSSPEAQMPPPALNSEEPQMHVSSPRDWTAQINSKCSHTTEPLHVRNGSGVQVPLDSRATDRGAPSS